MNEFILLYDSGVGGLSVLLECVNMLPDYNFLYFSDSKNAPYGNKSKKQLINIAIKNLSILKKKYDIPIIVFACNTLTTTVIDVLRKTFKDTVFIGTEPCIKLIKDLGFKRALVVATSATIKNSSVIKNYKSKNDIIIGDKNLASLIEKEVNNLYRIVPYIYKKYNRYKEKIDCVVLGCTHYVFAYSIFEKIFKIPIFDSGIYVARRVGHYANLLNIFKGNDLIFCDSGNDKQIFRYFNKIAFYKRSKYVMIDI